MTDDAETKKIAYLEFNIDKAKSSLDEINLKLKTISDSSEQYAKNIGLAINNGVNYKDIAKSIGLTEKELSKLTLHAGKEAITTREKREREEIKTTATLEREHIKQEQSVKTLYDKITNYANTYLIYQGFNMLKKGIQETIDEMVELESSMVQIDRVLNESSLNIDDYRDKLMQVAYDYANSMDNVTDITLRLAQAGFDSNESLELTEKTLLALNTAELNATQATDDMVAVMAQWGLMTGDANEEAKQYGAIIDKINKVADNFPTTSADIMDALKKVSSAFNLAGADIDETIATIVAAEKASQRGGKVIGTALSNIVQQIKAEGKLNLAEQLGLNFFKDANKTEFKPIMEIFQEMSDRMATLKSQGKESSTEMQQLLELFTVFRRNIGASLLGEMSGEDSTYMQVYKTSLDSVGYSLQENAKYMATTKAAQEQFNISLLDLKTKVWDNGVEDVYKSMLILGKQLVGNIGEIVDKFGGLPTIIGAATLAFSLLSKQMKVVSFDAKTGTANITGFAKNLTDGIKNLKNNITNYGLSLDTAALKTLALKTATIGLNLAASAAATAGMMLLTSIIQELINKEAAAIELQEKSIQSTEKQISAREDEISTLNDLIEEYDDLNSKSSLTPEETVKLHEIQAKIKKILGEQADTIDLINGKYDEQKKKLQELTLEKQKELLEEKKRLMEQKKNAVAEYSLPSEVEKRFGNKDFEKVIKQYGGTLLEPTGEFAEWEQERQLAYTLENSSIEEAIKLFTEWEEKLRSADKTNKEVNNTYNWIIETLNKMKDVIKEDDKATKDYYETLSQVVFNEMLNGGPKTQTQFGNIDINREGITWNTKNIEKYRGQLQDLNIDLKNLEGTYSNILGQSNAFNTEAGEVEIAYSPMLKTSKGLVPLYQDEVNEYIQEVVNQAQDAVKNGRFSSLKDAILAIDAEGIDNFVDTEGNKIKGLIADVGDTAEQTGKQMHENFEKLNISFDKDIDNVKEYAQLIEYIGKLDFNDLKIMGFEFDEENDSLAEVKERLIDLAERAFPEFATKAKETNNGLRETKEITKELSKELSDLESKYSMLSTAQKELNETGQITISTFQNLIDNNLLQYFDIVNGKLQVNEQKLINAANAAKEDAKAALQEKAAKEILNVIIADVNGTLSDSAEEEKNVSKESATAASQMIKLATAILTGTATAEDFQKAMQGLGITLGKDISGVSDKARKKIQDIISELNTNVAKIDRIKLSVASISGGSGGSGSSRRSSGSSGSSSSSSSKEDDAYKKRLEKFTETLEKIESKEADWVKKQKELGLLSNKDMLYVTKQRINTYTQYLKKIKQATWMNTEDRKKLQEEYTKKLKESQLDYFEYLKKKLDDEVKAIEDARDKKIKALEESTNKRIELLKKERDAEKEQNERQEILDDIEYWSQRTGREAVENLAEARKRLLEFDKDARIDAEIESLQEQEKKQKESLEKQAQDQIKALQKVYDSKVKAFSESDKIIYDNSVISAKNLYNAYKKNFVDPLSKELKDINKNTSTSSSSSTKTSTSTKSTGGSIQSKSVSQLASEVIKGVYGTGAARKKALGSRYAEVQAEVNRRYRTGKFHSGGKVGGTREAYALLKPNEVILKPEWANSLDRMMKYFDNVTQGKTNGISSNSVIEVEGNLVNIQANVRNQSDIDAIGQKVEKILKDKFNIKK